MGGCLFFSGGAALNEFHFFAILAIIPEKHQSKSNLVMTSNLKLVRCLHMLYSVTNILGVFFVAHISHFLL